MGKNKSLAYFLFLFLWVLTQSHCQKASVSKPLVLSSLPVSVDLQGIASPIFGHLYVVGGQRWESGYFFSSEDGGHTWTADSLINKQLRDIKATASGGLLLGGVDGHFFYKSNLAHSSWEYTNAPASPFINAIALNSQDALAYFGGIGFTTGVLGVANSNFSPFQSDSLGKELYDGAFISEHTLIAVGYGIILRSTDMGLTWEQVFEGSDFYKSVHFMDEESGFCVGSSGSILSTRNGGKTWESLQNGNNPFIGVSFNAVFFNKETDGAIVGDQGVIWITEDGGIEWKQLDHTSTADFQAVLIIDEMLYAVGEGGQLLTCHCF